MLLNVSRQTNYLKHIITTVEHASNDVVWSLHTVLMPNFTTRFSFKRIIKDKKKKWDK